MIRLTVGCVLLALASNVAAVSEWGQCGGMYYTGSTSCDAGLTCVYFNDWYSQCLIVSTTQAPPPPTSTSTTQAPPPPSSTSTTVVVPPPSSSTTSPPPPSSTTPTSTSTPPVTQTGSTAIGASPTCAGANVANSLATKIKAKGKKYFGTCADAGTLSNTQNANVIKQQFNQVTPENSMKWDTIEASQNNFNFGGGDTLVSFGQTNCDFIRGHNFVWHSQLPSWVSSISSASTLTSVIQNHIVHEGGRWAGKIYSWDVCNEILDESGNMRSSVFSNVLGETFVSIAYKQARATDPIAKLYINDYNLDTATYAKTTGMVSKVKTWKSQGIPIDGIGSQSHLSAGGAGGVQAALSALAGTGVQEVAITELDIAGGGASDYATTIKACLAVSACIGITVWGVSDKDSWRSSTTPLLFDSSYNPKPAWTSVIAAMS